ncbi:SdpI family protein [Bizionia echini]|uniref:SdpI family protein n=1 Tax=Bizionia echini TaxID=649333 RepID=UPI0030DCAD3A|tara:strand:- start:116 stop:472 length:357 start_codon:yes stop_codon:yes gene_type:complete
MNIPTDNPLFVIPISTGIVFVVVGFIMLKFPPKKINSLYGYRTASSMKNQERWDFAQLYSAKEMIKLGIVLEVSGLLGFILHLNDKTATLIGISYMIVLVIVLLIRVEYAIKKKFNSE